MIFSCMHCKQEALNVDKRAVSCRGCAEKLHIERLEFYDKFNLLGFVEETCKVIGHTKDDQNDIMLSLMEEAGETATEIKIARGLKSGPAGKDGVVGEAIDTILCALDVIYSEMGSVDNLLVKQTFYNKTMKWKNKYSTKA
ncbi:hypothetical protein D3C71_1340970 [compost metagenome]